MRKVDLGNYLKSYDSNKGLLKKLMGFTNNIESSRTTEMNRLKEIFDQKEIQELKNQDLIPSHYFLQIWDIMKPLMKDHETTHRASKKIAMAIQHKYSLLHFIETLEEKERASIIGYIVKEKMTTEEHGLANKFFLKTKLNELALRNNLRHINNVPILLKIVALLPYKLREIIANCNQELIKHPRDLVDLITLLPMSNREVIFIRYLERNNFAWDERLSPAFLCLNEDLFLHLCSSKLDLSRIISDNSKICSSMKITLVNSRLDILPICFRQRLDSGFYPNEFISPTLKTLYIPKFSDRKDDVPSHGYSKLPIRFTKYILRKTKIDMSTGLISSERYTEVNKWLKDEKLLDIFSHYQLLDNLFNLIKLYPLNERLPWAIHILTKINTLNTIDEKESWYEPLWILFTPLIPACQINDFFSLINYVPSYSSPVPKIRKFLEDSEIKTYADTFLNKTVNTQNSVALLRMLNFLPESPNMSISPHSKSTMRIEYAWKFAHWLKGMNIRSAILLLELLKHPTLEQLQEVDNLIKQNRDFLTIIYHLPYRSMDNYIYVLNMLSINEFKKFMTAQCERGAPKDLLQTCLFAYDTKNLDNHKKIHMQLEFLTNHSAAFVSDCKSDKKENSAEAKDLSNIFKGFHILEPDILKSISKVYTIEDAVLVLCSFPNYLQFAIYWLGMIIERRSRIDTELIAYFNTPGLRNIILEYQALSRATISMLRDKKSESQAYSGNVGDKKPLMTR